MPQQDAFGLQHVRNGGEDVAAHRLQPGREQLGHDPAVIAVDDQRGEAVALGVHHAVGGGIDARASREAGREPLAPPGGVDRPVGALEKPELDLRSGGEERLAHELVARIEDRRRDPAASGAAATSLR